MKKHTKIIYIRCCFIRNLRTIKYIIYPKAEKMLNAIPSAFPGGEKATQMLCLPAESAHPMKAVLTRTGGVSYPSTKIFMPFCIGMVVAKTLFSRQLICPLKMPLPEAACKVVNRF